MIGDPSVHPLCGRLRQRRLDLGLTLAQVGERAGMPLQQVGAYEIGTTTPKLPQFERWATALGLTIELR